LFTDSDSIELNSRKLDVAVRCCHYLYTNNVKLYEISIPKYLHIVLSIYFSVQDLTMAN